MTIKEVIKDCEGEFAWWEVYEGDHLHTDFCSWVEDADENAEVKNWEIMNLEDYENTILANTSVDPGLIDDFEHGDALIILI